MPTCLARYTTVKDKLYFGDGRHRFYIERCCGNDCDGEICSKCSIKNQVKVQDCRTFDHGLVTGPYLAKSQLYDSAYYHAAVEKYGAPNDEDIRKAMEAQQKARGGKTIEVASVVTEKEEKKPRKSAAAAVPKKTEEPEKKKAAPRKKAVKAIEVPQVVVPEEPVSKPVVHIPDNASVETMDEPLEVKEVIKVKLVTLTVGSTKYWRDPDREKVYKKTAGGKKGSYLGRWDSVLQRIEQDAPDSDSD